MERINFNFLVIFFSSFFLIISFSAHSEIYKYTDENGKTHYSDKPFSKKSEIVEVKTKKIKVDENQLERKKERERILDIYEEERELKKEKKAEEKEGRKARKAQCKSLQLELKDYKRNDSRLYELDENGDRYFLTDDDIKNRISILQEEVDKVCLKKWIIN